MTEGPGVENGARIRGEGVRTKKKRIGKKRKEKKNI
jgi:hypothetical protein